jgi:GTPase
LPDTLIDRETPVERALVIHPVRPDAGARDPQLRLVEAAGLAEALDLDVADARIEPLREIRPGQYFGPGKSAQLKELAEALGAGVVVLDDQISPVQQRNLEKALNAKVVDRTGLILEIFGRRARTREGRLQVELARLTYERSRLVRTWTHLERQRGGTGKTGGPGERQIELDRRLIADRIVKLKRELEDVRRTRGLQRASRRKVPYPVVALVGYTNAGKSTLFNRAASASVFAKDMPFATLDTTLRALRLPSGREVLLSDTVGFISDLPTELVAAFRATLEEVAEADVLVHVRDIADAETEAMKADVEEILERILEGRDRRPPVVEAWNKCDLLGPDDLEDARARARTSLARDGIPAVPVSALTGEGIAALLETVAAQLSADARPRSLVLPAGAGAARAWLYGRGAVLEEEADEEGRLVLSVRLTGEDEARLLARFGIAAAAIPGGMPVGVPGGAPGHVPGEVQV